MELGRLLKKQLDLWIDVAKRMYYVLEIKAIEGQFDNSVFSDRGYHTYWYSAQKRNLQRDCNF